MRSLFAVWFLGLTVIACTKKQENYSDSCSLNVLTYSSFASLLGPGKNISSEFKTISNCEVKYVRFTDNLKVKKLLTDSTIDVVLGIDLLSLSEFLPSQFRSYSNFKALKINSEIKSYSTEKFIPLNWSPLTIIAKNKKPAETNYEIVPIQKWKWKKKHLSLQDPRVSTTGQYFLWWWNSEKFNKLFSFTSIQSLSPSWSISYGLFKNEMVEATFTYLTSLVYEWEQNPNLKFLILENSYGHPLQIEFAALNALSKKTVLGEKFIDFLVSEAGQAVLAKNNYMFPSINSELLNQLFSKKVKKPLPKLPLLQINSLQDFVKDKTVILEKWKTNF